LISSEASGSITHFYKEAFREILHDFDIVPIELSDKNLHF